MATPAPESRLRRVAQQRVEHPIGATSRTPLRYDSVTDGSYRPLLDATPDALVVMNERGEILLVNLQTEQQFGYARAELIGRQVEHLIPEGLTERLAADRLRAMEALTSPIGTGIELMGRRKDGSHFPAEIMVSPVETTEGTVVMVAIRDVTLRQQAAEHLRQRMEELRCSNEDLRQFAYMASHDLQEPLRMVASFTQLLATRYKGRLGVDADEFIAFAIDGANRMRRLIDDLLAYSQIGATGGNRILTSTEDALQQAIRNLQAAIADTEALVTHDPLPAILADHGQMIQLFQNLIGNAIKYRSTAIPEVHVSVAKTGSTDWTFSVRDNGLGIEAQSFEKIFGVFQRLHTAEEFPGTGIGLAICKKIVERHGGRIAVESEPGHGSTFRFTLAGVGP